MPPSTLKVDVKAVRQGAVLRARQALAKARTTEQRHYARLALARAQRAAKGV